MIHSLLLDRVLDKRLADGLVERRDQGQVLGLVGHVVGRVDLLAQGRGLGAVVDGFLDRLFHVASRVSAQAGTARLHQQSNIAVGLDGASHGAGCDHLPGFPHPTGPAGPSFQNVCGPDREIEPLVGGLSSRGDLPGNGPHARSDRFPGRSLQPRAERHSSVGVSVQERSDLTLGRPLHPHHQKPSRAHAVQRRDPQEAAKFWVSARRKDASARNGEVPQGLVKLSTHRRIPSVMRRNICDTASRVMGKNKRNVP